MLIDRKNKIVLTNTDIWISSSDKTYPLKDIARFRVFYHRTEKLKIPVLIADFHDGSKYKRKQSKFSAAIDNWFFKGGVQIERLSYFEGTPEEIVTKLNNQLNSFRGMKSSEQTKKAKAL